MTWTSSEIQYNFLQKCCMHVLKCGPIPKHVGFIMDGNRRYAGQKHLRCSDGHIKGFLKLSEALQWCKDFGVKELSVYAFSIANFKRSQDEVSFLFKLAEEKLQELLDKRNELKENNICIRVVGNLGMLPLRIQRLASEIMLITRNNTKSTLNIYMAYTGRDELSQAVERLRTGVQDELIDSSDIDPHLLSHCLYARRSRPLDLLIRTSGEVRLSDFLVWHAARCGTVYKFIRNYWPDFSFWEFAQAIFYYQLSFTYLSGLNAPTPSAPASKKSCDPCELEDEARICRVERFLNFVDRTYWQKLEKLTCYADEASPTLGPDTRGISRSFGDPVRS